MGLDADVDAVAVFDVGLDLVRGEPECHLRLVGPAVTAATLIEARVADAMARANAGDERGPRGFYESCIEQELNGNREALDEAAEVARALQAFRANRFLLFVNDRQVEELHEELHIDDRSFVSFVRLVPLAGG